MTEPLPSPEKPTYAPWSHETNEWADATCAAYTWLKNIREGVSTADVAIENMDEVLNHCREVSADAAVERASRGDKLFNVACDWQNRAKALATQVNKLLTAYRGARGFQTTPDFDRDPVVVEARAVLYNVDTTVTATPGEKLVFQENTGKAWEDGTFEERESFLHGIRFQSPKHAPPPEVVNVVDHGGLSPLATVAVISTILRTYSLIKTDEQDCTLMKVETLRQLADRLSTAVLTEVMAGRS